MRGNDATPGHDCPGLIEATTEGSVLPPNVSVPLRGMIAPASLKQTFPPGWEWPAERPLRGMIAPASLKRRDIRSRERHPVRPTPGHDCPGLIEALQSSTRMRWFSSPTPGHDCPGLIEASMSKSAIPSLCIVPLRGMIAPASLKRRSIRSTQLPARRPHSGA